MPRGWARACAQSKRAKVRKSGCLVTWNGRFYRCNKPSAAETTPTASEGMLSWSRAVEEPAAACQTGCKHVRGSPECMLIVQLCPLLPHVILVSVDELSASRISAVL